MKLRLSEPGSLKDPLGRVRIDEASPMQLSRHLTAGPYGSTRVYRFDAPKPVQPGEFGTCHTANAIEVALAEGVIHARVRFAGSSYEAPVAELNERSVVHFSCGLRKARLPADLTGAALKSVGLNSDTSASGDCITSQALARAQAVHGETCPGTFSATCLGR